MKNFLLYQRLLNNMSNISELTLTKIVKGIKKKDFTSEEVTVSFVKNSQKSKKLNQGEWIYGFGWDQNLWDKKNYPDKDLLNSISPDNPPISTTIKLLITFLQ